MSGWTVNVPASVDKSVKQSPVCDYFGRNKLLTTQGSFQERLGRFAYPKTALLQLPVITDEEIREGLKLLEPLHKAVNDVFQVTQSDLGILSGDSRVFNALVQKTRYYEQQAPTNHLDIAPWIDKFPEVKIKKLPVL